ncbi:MAG: hypothetical protein OEY80_01125 [Nitrospirota bacterium]|jgi:hypothetical protein|nr:hypothetical protein [Nitrospirota bacterium]MDH4359452.1 hypothetical protein [Nitrospirota bacterium]MDH5295578.1 hypothetical protein [Nitrospirota bacterium]MDH5574063.1 hypothetical protein [Nitrospirota bacterium]
MNDNLWHQLNAVLGSLTVTVGLWLLVGALPVPLGIALAVGLAILLAWKSPSIGYIWAASTLLLGVESLAWPIMQMADIQKLGPEPPLEELQRIFTAVLFGLFSGVFWMTFAYGIFKRTRGANTPATPSVTTPQTKNQKKRARKQSG